MTGGFPHSSNAPQSRFTRIVNFAGSISVLACSAMEYHFGCVICGAISGASVSDYHSSVSAASPSEQYGSLCVQRITLVQT